MEPFEEGNTAVNTLVKPMGQELNMTIRDIKGGKLDIRIETHPISKKYGGSGLPQRHMNVDLYLNGRKRSLDLPNHGLVILED